MSQSCPTLLLTRPRAQAERFADQCRHAIDTDMAIRIAPVVEIMPRDVAIDLSGYDGVILSSENGARCLEGLVPAGLTAWCVGDRTARVARSFGLIAVSAGGAADDLVDLVSRAAPRGRILHVHGARVSGDIAGRLRDFGVNVEAECFYEQVERRLNADAISLLRDCPVVLPVFSPRSAQILGAQLPVECAALTVVTLSDAVAQALKDAWKGQNAPLFTVAKRPDAAHMITEIATIWASMPA